jgi:Tfp pilus assembly protein PilW
VKRAFLRRESGLTILEMAFTATIAASMLAAGVALTNTMRRGSAALAKKSALAGRAEEIAERLARELSVAGMTGEDVNKSGSLDSGEDKNRNNRLDADWSLANAASTSDFTYNVMRSTDWTWSGPIRWNLDGAGNLWRTENGASAEMARGVGAFTVSRSGEEVTVSVTLGGKDVTGESQSQSAERRVYVRN